MQEHIIYQDTYNQNGNKTKEGKNRQFSQQIGISYSTRMFEEMLDVKNQGINFTWETFQESVARLVTSSLFLSFSHTPKNIEELKNIAALAAKIEWANKVEEYSKDNILPIREKTKEEYIAYAMEQATFSFYLEKERESSREYFNRDDYDKKQKFFESINIEQYKKEAFEVFCNKISKYIENKNTVEIYQLEIYKKIDILYAKTKQELKVLEKEMTFPNKLRI